jgi:DnaJ-class molecular chaperone
MDTYPSEAQLASPQEDLPCTSCDGNGKVGFMCQTPHGPVDGARQCDACEGTGSRYVEYLNAHSEEPE